MKSHALLFTVAALLSSSTIVHAEEIAAERRLAHEQQQIDQGISVEDARRILVLSNDFKVQPELVQSMRNRGQAWSEMTVALATADLLHKQHTAQFPTQPAALAQVESLRGAGRSWGQVVDDLRLELEPVVVATQKARIEMHGDAWEARPYARLDGMLLPGRVERPITREALSTRPEIVDRPARPRDIERPEPPVRPEVPERPEPPVAVVDRPPVIDRPERPTVPEVERPEVPETPDVPERPDVVDIERPEVPETPELPEAPEIPELPEAVERPELPEVEVPEAPEIPEVPEVPETPELPEIPETSVAVDRPQIIERVETPRLERPEAQDRPGRPDRPEAQGR